MMPLDELCSNVYVLEHDGNVILIDSGTASMKKHLAALKGKTLEKILLTHGHFDHVQGASGFENVFLHEDDLNNFARINSFLPSFTPPKALPLEMKKIVFGGFTIQPISTPGHTPGSTVFLEEKTKTLFSGDSLFAGGGLGRTDLPLSNPFDYEKTLEKIASLDFNMLCPGHGETEKRI